MHWWFALCGALVVVPCMARAQATFTQLATLPGETESGGVSALSDSGTKVIGSTASGRAWFWTASTGTVELLPLPEHTSGEPYFAVNVSSDGSHVVGTGGSLTTPQAVMWSDPNGSPTPLGGSIATDVSADGAVVVGTDLPFPSPLRAWRWTQATGIVFLTGPSVRSRALAVTNDGATAFGSINGTFVPVAWTGTDPGVLLDLPAGGVTGEVMVASGDGAVLAGEVDVDAFAWIDGTPIPIFRPKLLTDRPSARAVAAGGNVVGGVVDVVVVDPRAFIWDAHFGTRDLTTVANDNGAALGSFKLESVSGISADGLVMAGVGRATGGPQTAWLLTLPASVFAVPASTLSLWAFAILAAALAISLRRRDGGAAVPTSRLWAGVDEP